MDVLLGKVTSQAMNYAIKSGITITTTYAIKQCGRLLKEVPRSEAREDLMQLQLRLESKIRIISPAIDMIELISARGNTSLESAVSLTKEIRYEIQRLGTRLSDAVEDERLLKTKSSKAKSRDETERQLQSIVSDIKKLLVKIEDAVPLISLAITTSGVNLSTKLSGTISPSRLLQASTFLTAADSKFAAQPGSRVQVGPTYVLSLYMLFAGHAWRPVDENGVRETTWKEVIHKAKLKLMRVPLDELYELPGAKTKTLNGGFVADSIPGDAKSAEFAYQLVLIEDLDDDRVHTFEDGEREPAAFDDVPHAGIRDVLPVHEISKVFYADTGKILNIGGDGESNNPVLLLRRDVHAEPPRRMMHRSQMGEDGYYDDSLLDGVAGHHSEVDAQLHQESTSNTSVKDSPRRGNSEANAWRLPANLDPEWMAFEVYIEEEDSDTEPEETPANSRPTSRREDSPATALTGAISKLNLKSSTPSSSPTTNGKQIIHSHPVNTNSAPTSTRPLPQIKTSLSLLEMLLKLTALQQFRQESHLSIEDELLNFFLEDSSSAGAGSDKDYRQRLRHNAVKRVGFDPYDESPIKRRGEVYLNHARGAASPRPSFDAEAFMAAGGNSYEHGLDGYKDEPRHGLSSPQLPVQASIEFEQDEALPSSPSPQPSLHASPPTRGLAARSPRPHSIALLRKEAPLSSTHRQTFERAGSEPTTQSPLASSEVAEFEVADLEAAGVI